MAQKNVFPGGSDVYVKDADGNEYKVHGSGGQSYEDVASASTDENLANYGVSLLSWSTAGDPGYTLGAPEGGLRKLLVLQTTTVQDSTAIFTSVYTGSTAIFIIDNSTTYAPKLYAGFAPPYSAVELIGLSDSVWGVVNAYGGAKFSTSAAFSS